MDAIYDLPLLAQGILGLLFMTAMAFFIIYATEWFYVMFEKRKK